MMRNFDPFRPLPEKLRGGVNPYLDYLKNCESIVNGSLTKLPVLHTEHLRSKAGRWRSYFGRPEPTKLFVEIGSHYGHTLAELSGEYPDYCFLGLDITYKRVVKTAEKLLRHEKSRVNNNSRSLMTYASQQTWPLLFEKEEIDGVLIFFPDPWSKKSQLKNRLLNTEFVHQLILSLRSDGFIWLRTDHQEYFDSVCNLVEKEFPNLREQQGIPDCFTSTEAAPQSSFSNLFGNQGLTIYEAVWSKPSGLINV